jgi:hypothetical protein
LLPYSNTDSNLNAFPDNENNACGIDSSSKGVWYKLSPGADTIGQVTVQNQEFSAKIAIFTGSCGSLTCLDSTLGFRYSDQVLTWVASSTTDYYVLIASSSAEGNYDITIEVCMKM